MTKRFREVLALLGWVALCFAAAATSVFVTTTGWYAELAKPSRNLPSWLFGPVWSAPYVMMAVAAWLVWKRGGWPGRRPGRRLFLVQWFLNTLRTLPSSACMAWTLRSSRSRCSGS